MMPPQLSPELAAVDKWELREGILAKLFWSKSTRPLLLPRKLVMMSTGISRLKGIVDRNSRIDLGKLTTLTSCSFR